MVLKRYIMESFKCVASFHSDTNTEIDCIHVFLFSIKSNAYSSYNFCSHMFEQQLRCNMV